MNWVYTELLLISLAAMLSPTTLSFSIFVLVLAERPRRSGSYFYLGALGATLAIGVAAAFVLGNVATSHDSSQPKTWVAILDVAFGALALAYVARTRNKPIDPETVNGMAARMTKVASSSAIAIVGAGAALANPGAFIPLALKSISETDPSAAQYVVEWVAFTLISLLPLGLALVLLTLSRDRAERLLARTRDWVIAHARTVASIIVFLLGVTLLRNGIAGLT